MSHNPEYLGPGPDEKKMVCEECGKSFQQRGSLINHLAKHHSKSVKSEAKHEAREFKDKIKKERKGSLAETEIGIEHVEVSPAFPVLLSVKVVSHQARPLNIKIVTLKSLNTISMKK